MENFKLMRPIKYGLPSKGRKLTIGKKLWKMILGLKNISFFTHFLVTCLGTQQKYKGLKKISILAILERLICAQQPAGT